MAIDKKSACDCTNESLNSTWLDFVDSIEKYIKVNEELEEQARIDGLQLASLA